jgi:phosphoribosylaminoimidazole carboxylase PurE protein
MKKKLVAIVMGSDSDLPVMQEAGKLLDEFNVGYNITISSAHRSPELTAAFAKNAAQKGFEVIIAGAGGAAHLAGVIASKTTLPVIGVPIDSSSLKGLDALLSTVQMPSGVPVATMAIGKAGLAKQVPKMRQSMQFKYLRSSIPSSKRSSRSTKNALPAASLKKPAG